MTFQPNRGDEVEAWIKRERDKYNAVSGYNSYASVSFWAINRLLDDYRLHADTGVPLSEEISEEILRGDPGKTYEDITGRKPRWQE